MTEFIGSRISLISKRDIRYVGTLHEISSENSTVALEQVVSFGTEGRRSDDEVPPSDNVYEYIVFRGSDVKDLRIEEGPKDTHPPKPPQVPDDPAILGSARRITPASVSNANATAPATQGPQVAQALPNKHSQSLHNQQPPNQHNPQHRHGPPPQFNQQAPYPYGYPPPNQRFGPQGYPGGPGFQGMGYGVPPPGWYGPPPGYGFSPMPPGQFQPLMTAGPPGNPQRQQLAPQAPAAPIPNEPALSKDDSKPASKPDSPKEVVKVKLPSASTPPAPPQVSQAAPPPPTASKPDIEAALAPPAPANATVEPANPVAPKSIPSGPKSGRIVPAVPISNKAGKSSTNGALKSASGNVPQIPVTQTPMQNTTTSKPAASKLNDDANRDARAAVAAAMAKLPPAPGQRKHGDGGSMDNLTRQVNEMRTNEHNRTSRQPGTGEYVATHRGGRGGRGGGRTQSDQQGRKIELPKADYDFETANAKFNKQDLVKEAIASGSPVAASGEGLGADGIALGADINGGRKASDPAITIPVGVSYNKSSSFFDNISSESKDRVGDGSQRLGGREFRSEERQKNLETFGQGSVDNNYRPGYGRGRGRGRGFGRGRAGRGAFEGRGGGRNGFRGGQGSIADA